VMIPSDANFVTFKTQAEAASIQAKLSAEGVSVRLVRGIPGLGDCLRVTVAPRPLMAEFLTRLRGALG